jgi:hypothetical protein
VSIVNENFIPVAVDARRENARKDAVGEMVRKGGWVAITATGKTVVVTASGKTLGNVMGISEKHRISSFDKILKAWKDLPEVERKLGKVDLGESDAKRPLAEPPPGTLIVCVFNRQFEREKDKLRYTEEADYAEGEGKNGWERFRESAQDTMWIPETEWKAFIPAKAEKGQTFAAPDSFQLRLFKYHLDPERGLGEGVTFGNAKADAGKITVTVEEVSADLLRLRLQGTVKLVKGGPKDKQTVYEPTLLGYLTYDFRARAITQLNMVALGDVTNTPRGVRPGVHPLGIAFELVREPTTAERVPPRGARDDLERYLKCASK